MQSIHGIWFISNNNKIFQWVMLVYINVTTAYQGVVQWKKRVPTSLFLERLRFLMMQAAWPAITGSVVCADRSVPRLCSSSAHTRASWEQQAGFPLHPVQTAPTHSNATLQQTVRRVLLSSFNPAAKQLHPVPFLPKHGLLTGTCYRELQPLRSSFYSINV